MEIFNMWKNKTPEQIRGMIEKGRDTKRKNKEARERLEQESKIDLFRIKNEIDRLKEELNNLKSHETFALCSAKLTNKTLLSREEIVKNSLDYEGATGIYFLICNDEVIYVGQSVNVHARLSCHKTEKKFDKYAYIPCEKNCLDKLESLYIHYLKPKLNGEFKSGIKQSPINLKNLIDI